MRYTTVIDISEAPEVYRNINARLLYFHMSLKAGWHDSDRDRLTASIRMLAADSGLTVSATRHAIRKLMEASLLKREEDGRWYVKKWHLDTPPTPRPKKSQAADAKSANSIHDAMQRQIKEWQQKVMAAVRASTKEELEAWLAELEEGRSLKHHGVSMLANVNNIEWLRNVIKQA